jgi:hypothetical protein
VFSQARLDGFAFDAEALLLAGRLGLAVAEVPVRAQRRAPAVASATTIRSRYGSSTPPADLGPP